MSENPNAFPVNTTGLIEPSAGMTLRDWFAGQCLSGLLEGCSSDKDGSFDTEAFAIDAYRLADAMLAERERQS